MLGRRAVSCAFLAAATVPMVAPPAPSFADAPVLLRTVAYADLVEAGSQGKAKEAGKVRAEGKEYEVQEGDTLCTIGACFNRTTDDLYEQNQIIIADPNLIFPGDRLRIR